VEKRVRRTKKTRKKTFIEVQLKDLPMIDDNYDRWDNIFLTSEKDTASSSGDNDDSNE
jgi:hypothetical protein